VSALCPNEIDEASNTIENMRITISEKLVENICIRPHMVSGDEMRLGCLQGVRCDQPC
jgi:hypothetical protein